MSRWSQKIQSKSQIGMCFWTYWSCPFVENEYCRLCLYHLWLVTFPNNCCKGNYCSLKLYQHQTVTILITKKSHFKGLISEKYGHSVDVQYTFLLFCIHPFSHSLFLFPIFISPLEAVSISTALPRNEVAKETKNKSLRFFQQGHFGCRWFYEGKPEKWRLKSAKVSDFLQCVLPSATSSQATPKKDEKRE